MSTYVLTLTRLITAISAMWQIGDESFQSGKNGIYCSILLLHCLINHKLIFRDALFYTEDIVAGCGD